MFAFSGYIGYNTTAAELAAVNAVDYEPTPALPGTDAKILVLMDRASRRLPLFHPADRLIPDGNTPDEQGPIPTRIRDDAFGREKQANYQRWLNAQPEGGA